ncbi:MAG: hypothetical protein ABIG32_03930 [Candidatus Uhrbacteria bacterium]|nr:hypothetical protein [Patescibacteria group bacterium]MBU1906700.1 hypothetical protein [Patescibacteria group bacterium]
MTFKHYLIVMGIGTAGAWAAWVLTLFVIDPTQTSIMGFLFFYVTLFMSLVGSFAIIGAAIRVGIKKPNVISRQVGTAFRHSILFSLLIIGSMILLSHDILYWWSMVLFIAVIALFELFFLSTKPRRRAVREPDIPRLETE